MRYQRGASLSNSMPDHATQAQNQLGANVCSVFAHLVEKNAEALLMEAAMKMGSGVAIQEGGRQSERIGK
jgi:hypothetical protein